MRKPKLASLGIVVRDRATQGAYDYIDCDNLISVRADEFGSAVPAFVRDAAPNSLYDRVTVVNHSNKHLDLGPMLDELVTRLSSDSWIEIKWSHITGADLNRIVRHFTCADFRGCAFQKGWWSLESELAKCATLYLTCCAFARPPKTEPGVAAWPALKALVLDEGFANDEIYNHPQHHEAQRVAANRLNGRIADVAACFVGPGLRTLGLSGMESLTFLRGFPKALRLTYLDIDWTSTSVEAFEWVTRQRNLRNLSLSWGPGAGLDFSLLLGLKKLRDFSIDTDHLTDDEFAIIAKHPVIRSLCIYHCHGLTEKSWPAVLRMQSLRHLEFSNNMVAEPLPEDLPDTTNLQSVYGINVAPAKMRALQAGFARYPDLKVDWERFYDDEDAPARCCYCCTTYVTVGGEDGFTVDLP